jgi:hypothetical protein
MTTKKFSIPLLIDLCLHRYAVPVELRHALIIQSYCFSSLDNTTIRKAVKIWCCATDDKAIENYDEETKVQVRWKMEQIRLKYGDIADWDTS